MRIVQLPAREISRFDSNGVDMDFLPQVLDAERTTVHLARIVAGGRLVCDFLTLERLTSYLVAADADLEAAFELYEWNHRASLSALGLTSMIEVVVRNAIDCRADAWVLALSGGIPVSRIVVGSSVARRVS